MVSSSHDAGRDFGLPVRAALHPTGLYLALRQIDPAELGDAFMQETVARVTSNERIVHVEKERLGHADRGAAPAGIVFHVARCGSTLISQSLKKLDNLVVYAEPQPFNEILAPPHRWTRAERIAALRTLGAAFAHHARGPFVLKLSSWNTLYCDIVTDAFPETPWVLSLRDPIEVGVSMLASPPGWLGATSDASRHLAARVDPDGAAKSREELVARAYGAFCEAAGRLDPRGGRLVHYEGLPAAVWTVVAPHFSLPVDARQREEIARAARSHAKAPIGKAVEFVSDAATKRAAASAELRDAIDSFARAPLERLIGLHAHTMAR